MFDRDRHAGATDETELLVESLAHGTILRVPESSSKWILADDGDVVDAEKRV